MDSPTYSAQSDGAHTYLAGPDRFQELKEWFEEFCLKELKETEVLCCSLNNLDLSKCKKNILVFK